METESLNRLQLLHPMIRQAAIDAYNEAVKDTPGAVHPIITQTMRTLEQQDALYAQGRFKIPGKIVTNSRGGQSYHNYGLAIDFTLEINGKLSWEVDNNWMIVVNWFKDHGFAWGGEWKGLKDFPHFENRLGRNWRELIKMYDQKDFIPGTKFLKL